MNIQIKIKDITEGNKGKKIDCLEKSFFEKLTKGNSLVEYIEKDDSKIIKNIVTLNIRNFDKNKLQKAVSTLSFSLDTKLKAPKGETFLWKSQEDLTNSFTEDFGETTKKLYSFLISYFGLPEMRIVTKANLTHKGKVLYSPETGKPISMSEWNNFVKNLEKFFVKNYGTTGVKMVLSASALGRILDRMLETNTLQAIQNKKLEELKYKGKRFEWISNSVKNMVDTFGNSFDREQQARIQVMQQSAAMRITKVTSVMRSDIQQILIDGIKNKESKSVISQHLFDKCVGMNRDFQRIADTEIANATNDAYIQESVYNTPPGEKIYFKRNEMLDDNTCPECRAMDGEIVLWSDTSLPTAKIKDEFASKAMWEGSGINDKGKNSVPNGTLHPYCRGGWIRYYPEADALFDRK